MIDNTFMYCIICTQGLRRYAMACECWRRYATACEQDCEGWWRLANACEHGMIRHRRHNAVISRLMLIDDWWLMSDDLWLMSDDYRVGFRHVCVDQWAVLSRCANERNMWRYRPKRDGLRRKQIGGVIWMRFAKDFILRHLFFSYSTVFQSPSRSARRSSQQWTAAPPDWRSPSWCVAGCSATAAAPEFASSSAAL